MFSNSTHTSNPFQSFPSSLSSSSYPPLPPFYIDPENAYAASDTHSHTKTNTILHHDPSLAGVPAFMPSTTQAPILSSEPVTNLMVADYASMMLQRDANGYGGASSFFLTKKPAAKKDRHSKIFTSQGLRDRRVRLSSEIARKFFDLQDMLEYDKPSSTLEWLFTKSENAIKELARSKHSCSGDARCLCFSPELQGVGVDSNEKSSFAGASACNKEGKLKWVENEIDVCVQAKKEPREKARARARGRTNSKSKERFPAIADPRILDQLMQPIHPHHTHLWVMGSEAPREGFEAAINEGTGVLKRDLKPSLVEIPVGATSFNNNEYDYNSSPNEQSTSFCGIASMNLSTELQIFGKSWEECTNKRRH